MSARKSKVDAIHFPGGRMLVRKLIAAVAMSLALAWSASAQTPPADQAPPAGTAAPATKKPAKKKAEKKAAPAKSSKKKKGATPAPPPKTDVDEETRKALESMTPAPAAPAAAPAPAPAEEAYKGPVDDDPPVLTHTPVTAAKKGKPFTVTAHAVDPSGIFGPILYLRKKGMASTDYIPMRMSPSKTAPGEFALEIPAALVHVDALEYYIEAWDNAGNGPSRAGSPESPLPVKLEEEKKIVVAPSEPVAPTNVVVKQKGAPPAISHTAVTQATKGQSIEINARLVGDTGVKDAIVLFRHVGETEYKTLPMGNVGGDNYTATVPGTMANADVEYYLEAFDKYGNGPGRSGAPNVPYVIKVLEAQAGAELTSAGTTPAGPKIVKAPFAPNPGRSAAWFFMSGFVGGLVFAGGEAFASLTQHNAYTANYDGRLKPDLLKAANASGDRAKTALIVAGGSLVVGVVLLIVFPAHPDTIVIGGGGDVGVRF
jgi:hypothetical protein